MVHTDMPNSCVICLLKPLPQIKYWTGKLLMLFVVSYGFSYKLNMHEVWIGLKQYCQNKIKAFIFCLPFSHLGACEFFSVFVIVGKCTHQAPDRRHAAQIFPGSYKKTNTKHNLKKGCNFYCAPTIVFGIFPSLYLKKLKNKLKLWMLK